MLDAALTHVTSYKTTDGSPKPLTRGSPLLPRLGASTPGAGGGSCVNTKADATLQQEQQAAKGPLGKILEGVHELLLALGCHSAMDKEVSDGFPSFGYRGVDQKSMEKRLRLSWLGTGDDVYLRSNKRITGAKSAVLAGGRSTAVSVSAISGGG